MIKVGQKFQEARIAKDLTLEDVSKSTKIKKQFLEAIEKGEYEKLPSVTYAQGFVRNYARFLEMPEAETLALFRREFDEEKSLKVLPSGFAKTKEFPVSRFKVKQTIIFGLLICFVILAYIIFQYRGALVNPSLTVSSPLENSQIDSSVVTVTGKTDPNATVYVSNYQVTVDNNGVFSKVINVFPGKTTLTVTAVNPFGKQTTIKRDIEVKPGS